jgi:hypothetical protein
MAALPKPQSPRAQQAIGCSRPIAEKLFVNISHGFSPATATALEGPLRQDVSGTNFDS